MMRLLSAFLVLCSVASAQPQSFWRDAAVAPLVPAYDWTNSYSLVLSVPKAMTQTDQQLCVINGTSSNIAVVDWGDNKSNPAGGGTDAITSPEVAVGAGGSFCVPMTSWGPYTFVRSMTGGNIVIGTVFGFLR